MKLSICMMVKNESKYLEKCLTSLQPILKKIKSELIIVDTGSEDNTVEIAKKFTDKVYYHEWTNDFSEMRNLTISYAKGEWLFIIDGDEVVENPKDIIDFLMSVSSRKHNAATIIIKNFTRDNDDEVFVESPVLRLFKRKGFKFEGKIHEQPQIKGPIYFIDTRLLHYGYISTDKELMERKFKRNVEILKKELERDPENVYYWYQLSLSHSMHNDFKESLENIIKAYEITKEKNIDLSNRMYIYIHLATCYYQNYKYTELENICNEAIGTKDGYIDIYFFLGKAQKELKKLEEAKQSFKKYLEMQKDYKKYIGYIDFSVNNLTLFRYEEVYMDLCEIYQSQEKYEEVLTYSSKIKKEEILKQIFPKVINAYLKLEKYKELKGYYTLTINEKNNLKDDFLNTLEKIKLYLDDEVQQKLTELFSDLSDEYGLLNTIRSKYLNCNQITSEISQLISKIDLKEMPYYYGDIIYYLLVNKIEIANIDPRINSRKIEEFLNYLLIKYKDLHNTILNYITYSNSDFDLNKVRFNTVLYRILLLSDKLDKAKYSMIIDKYIKEGSYYLKEIYNEKVLKEEMIYAIKDQEDSFMISLYLANQVKDQDKLKYVKYLRKALKLYPTMKKVVEFLLDEVKESTTTTSSNIQVNNEFEELKNTIKNNIKNYINNGEIDTAENLINEYEKLVQNDGDIYSIKAVIALLNNRLDEASLLINKGLEYEPNNCDLLYNKGYLYELKGKVKEAKEVYQRILEITDDQELIKEIRHKLSNNVDEIKIQDLDNRGNVNVLDERKDDIKEEFENYKKKVKENINILIEEERLDEAKEIIKEYEKIVQNDIDIYSIKRDVLIMEENIQKAAKIIYEGTKSLKSCKKTIKDKRQDLKSVIIDEKMAAKKNLDKINLIQEKLTKKYNL